MKQEKTLFSFFFSDTSSYTHPTEYKQMQHNKFFMKSLVNKNMGNA